MGTGKIVFIRADANDIIASGHIMRCLTIAHALRQTGSQVTFLVSDEDSVSMLQSRQETDILCLNSSWNHLESELSSLLPILKKHHVDILLLDSYFVTRQYMEAIQEVCRLVYIDDLQSFSYSADLIINYDLVVDAAFYQDIPALLGASYTPLREQFQSVSYSVRETVSSILITTGGSDQYHTASGIIESMKQYAFYQQPNLTISVLIGKMSGDKDCLHHLAKQDKRICLYENILDMASLLTSCDFAFSAGGTTLFELCAVGVPSISFSISDVQMDCVNAFAKKDIIPYAGDIRDGASFVSHLLELGIKKAEDYEARKLTSAKMRDLIDGNGAARIAAAILDLIP